MNQNERQQGNAARGQPLQRVMTKLRKLAGASEPSTKGGRISTGDESCDQTPPPQLRQPKSLTPIAQSPSEFKTFGDPCLELAVREADRFLAEMHNLQPPRWLTFLGTSGTGKTYLGKLITRRAVFPAGAGGLYRISWDCTWRWKDYLGMIYQKRYEIRDVLSERPFVVLDEIGSNEKVTDFAVEELFQLLEHRLGKWTVITANINLETIGARYDPRISSRLVRDRNVCVAIETIDYALRNQTAG